ncbi:EndoU domain-containing protein [Amycolatopsis suaedae]|uniref:Bacterial EndoU nuclease domain-containing protein n=1 Tax=Amycolatopsis suaedae TaxID=2510978 RepID=A0A4Q7JDF4_9PSEU|nr:EndoU domain-containing protein [Amycolatopsis suaedae]RZQ65092.1 hypothetical protein EWH70_04125 [Amycolatopsis suaedae]
MTVIKAGWEALTERESALGEAGRAWDADFEDLEFGLRALHASWKGLGADAFGRAIDEWRAAAEEMREVLRDIERRMGTVQSNYGSAVRSANELWAGGGGAAPGASGGFEITVDSLRETVRTIADVQLGLVAAVDRATGALAATGGMVGDALLEGWREPYDRCAKAVCNAVGGVVTVLGAVAISLKDTANRFLEAEEANGAPPEEPIPFPGTRSDFEMAPPPGSGGQGPEPFVPEILAGFWPNAHLDRLWGAAEAWRQLGFKLFEANQVATRAFMALSEQNQGETFSLIRGYWGALCSGENCRPDLPFDCAFVTTMAMAGSCKTLADAIAEVQHGVANAVNNATEQLEVFEQIAIAMDALLTRGASQWVVKVATAFWAGADMADFRHAYLANLRSAIDQLPTEYQNALNLFGDTHKKTLVEGGRLEQVDDVVMGELRGKWDEVEGDHPRPDQIHITQDRVVHILDGDGPGLGGGHRHGTGKPGKTEFPDDWDDPQITNNVVSVARNPDSVELQSNGRYKLSGVRDGVHIIVIVMPDGRVWTAWPPPQPGITKNPK